MQKQDLISEDKITKAKQQNEIQLTRDPKVTSRVFLITVAARGQPRCCSAVEKSMGRSWLDSQGISYLFLLFYFILLQITIAIDVSDRRGVRSQKLQQRMS